MRCFLLPILALVPFLACSAVQAQPSDSGAPALSAQSPSAKPRPRARQAAKRAPVSREAGQYFVEFRSRYALSYGHTFLVHGRLNAKGDVGPLTDKNVAGFHPAGAGPELWSLGHIIPVTSETGPSDGDLEEQYVSARYRVILSEPEYRRVAAYIHQKQRANVPWHAAVYNCNAWVGEVAQYMGLQAPATHWLYPANYINAMKALNS